MAGKDIIVLSVRELKRLKIVQKIIDKEITQRKAAEILELCDRQVRRIVKRVREEGDTGVTHRSRGKPSPRAVPEEQKKEILRLYKEKYTGFGPTLATEKLMETDKLPLSRETLRGWLSGEGLSYKGRKKRPHRRWRERKEHAGEMVQIDGSHHDWLEGRGPKLVLMGYIDDATNNVFARFYDYEGVIPAMDSFKRYVKKYGIPQSVYVDRHTTYKSNAKPSTEDNLDNAKPLSQFERALGEIGVRVIHANSPQGKGRVERLFGTLQDRLVKDMRLKNIKTKAEANKFLHSYLPRHNKKFKLKDTQGADLHCPVPQGIELDSVFSEKNKRALRKDNTITENGNLYQIEEKTGAVCLSVEKRTNGKTVISHEGKALKYHKIEKRPAEVSSAEETRTPQVTTSRQPHKPSPKHPWRRTEVKGQKQKTT